MTYSWLDLVGNIGVAVVLLEYWRLQAGRTSPDDLRYSLANAAGAGLILVSLTGNFNLSAFAVEAFWFGISLYDALRLHGIRRGPAS